MMTHNRHVVQILSVAMLRAGVAWSGEYTEALLLDEAQPTIRFTSGNTLCREALVDGHWVTQFRSGDGRIPMPFEYWTDDSFVLDVGGAPVNTGLTWVGLTDEPHQTGPGRHVTIRLRNESAELDIAVHTLLDGTPVLSRWLEITNSSGVARPIVWVSPWAGRLSRGSGWTLGYFTDDNHGQEGWFEWMDLPQWRTTLRGVKGQGHEAPFFILRNDGTGEYFIGQLQWTANWKLEFINGIRGIVTFQFGPHAEAPLRVLAPGETVVTPAAHLGHTSGDLDAAVQGMHAHVRRSVLPARGEKDFGLIQYVLPGDQIYSTPLDEAATKEQIDLAAEIGAELFILDAYWWDITGDWEPSATRFPNGLEPLIQHAKSKGLQFGLYSEPEGGRGNVRESRAAMEHPEWLGPKDQFNVGIPEAAAWVESEIVRLVEQYELDLFRIDYNAEDTGGGLTTVQHGIPENNYWRYYEGAWVIYDRVRARFPNLILQQAAGGGARNDLGTMAHFHESYLTDGLNIPREQQSFAGQSLAFPPEMLVLLHGATGHLSPGYPENFDTILRTSFSLGTPQIFWSNVAPSAGALTPTRRDRFLHYANIYKEFIRPKMPDCRMYHHAPVSDSGGVESGGWFAVEFTSADRRAGWATIVRIGKTDSPIYRFRPRGLLMERDYTVTLDSLDTTAVICGADLFIHGLPIRMESMAMSELILFEEK